MRPVAKAGLVAIGYIAALAIALLVVSIYVAATSGPDRQGSSGMYAFGDSLLFLATFGLAAVPATGAALFFLRPRPAFWVTLSVASLAVASTSLAAFLIYVAPTAFDSRSLLHSWSDFAVLRILVAPLFAIVFALSGLFAPNRSARISLMAATTIEMTVFAYAAFTWFHPFHQ
jgi:hypothetical protein